MTVRDTIVRAVIRDIERIAFGIMLAGVGFTLFVVPEYSGYGLGLFVGVYLIAFLADEFVEEDRLLELAGVDQ